MIRFGSKEIADEAREVFATNLQHCVRITREEWIRSRTLWRRLKQRLAFYLLARLDLYLARKQWRALPD
jgi:cardiolipin synthase